MCLGGCKQGVQIGLSYAATRLTVGPSGKSDTAILKYELQQRELLPLLAETYVMNFCLNYGTRGKQMREIKGKGASSGKAGGQTQRTTAQDKQEPRDEERRWTGLLSLLLTVLFFSCTCV